MKAILITISRTYVRTFYEANALTFLILFGFAGGVLSGQEHMALATIFASAPVYTLIPLAVWLLFVIKVVLYNRNVSRAPENVFTHHLAIAPRSVQWISSLVVATEQCTPIVLYAGFLMVVAAMLGQIQVMVIVFLELTLLLLLCGGSLRLQWHSSAEYSWRGSLLKSFHSYPAIALQWLLRSFPGLIIVTKCFNVLLLFGLCRMHWLDDYDIRLLAIGTVFTSGTTAFVLHHLARFENHTFGLVRTLPVPIIRRALWTLILIFLLQVPELTTIRWNLPEARTDWEVVQLLFLTLTVQFAVYTHLLRKPLSLDQFSRRTFAITMVLFITVLFGVPIMLLIGGTAAYGMLFATHFYKFEFSAEPG